MNGICCGTGKFVVNPGRRNFVGGAAIDPILRGAVAAIGCGRNGLGERSMIVGTPKEIKNHEYRVGLTPESARELVAHGHRVLVETGAGEGIGRSEEPTSELQSLMRISYAGICLKKKKNKYKT